MMAEIHIPSATPCSEVDGVSPENSILRDGTNNFNRSDTNLTSDGNNIFTKKEYGGDESQFRREAADVDGVDERNDSVARQQSSLVVKETTRRQRTETVDSLTLTKDNTLESIKLAQKNRMVVDKEPENENNFIPDIEMNLLAVEVASIDPRLGNLCSLPQTPASRATNYTTSSDDNQFQPNAANTRPSNKPELSMENVAKMEQLENLEERAKVREARMKEKIVAGNEARLGSTTPSADRQTETGDGSMFSTAVDENVLESAKQRNNKSPLFLPENWKSRDKPLTTMSEVITSKAKEQRTKKVSVSQQMTKRLPTTPSFIKTKGSMKSQLIVGLRVYEEVTASKTSKLYRSAIELMNEGEFEQAIMPITKAINLKSEEPDFYICRGECSLQIADFQSAILNYKKACSLQPTDQRLYSKLAFIYFFQGQCLFDQKLYAEALESFTKAAEMKPEVKGYHTRSIACLTALQRHGECLALINKRLEQERDNPDLYVMRARLHDLFQNNALCSYDVKDALMLNPEHPEALKLLAKMQQQARENKQHAVSLNLIGKHKEALQKITTAIDTDPSCPDYHVFRGALYRRMGDFNAAIDDYLLALDKTDHNEESPIYLDAQRQLLLTYNDFAVECFSKGYYEEAVVLLNKAIKGEKREKGLYINRGDCFYRQGDLHFSLADYHQALEIDPYDMSVRSRISVVHNEFGVVEYQDRNFEEAESRFTLAIQNNPKIGHYYVSRCRARYILENHNQAREDILYAILLDPQNEEIMSMLSRLFPGKSAKDVLQSKAADTARLALQNAVVTASPVRLPPVSDNLSMLTFKEDDDQSLYVIPPTRELTTREKTPFSEAPPPTPETEQPIASKSTGCFPDLRQCMEERDFHIKIAKEKKKINNAVKDALNNRKTLRKDKQHRVVTLPAAVPFYTHSGTPDIPKTKKKGEPVGWRKFGGIQA